MSSSSSSSDDVNKTEEDLDREIAEWTKANEARRAENEKALGVKRKAKQLQDLKDQSEALARDGMSAGDLRYDEEEPSKKKQQTFLDGDDKSVVDGKGYENARNESMMVRRLLSDINYSLAATQQKTSFSVSLLKQQLKICFTNVQIQGYSAPGGIMTGNFQEERVRKAVGASIANSRLMTENGLFELTLSPAGPPWETAIFGPTGAGTGQRDTVEMLEVFSTFLQVLNPETPDTTEGLRGRMKPGGDLSSYDPVFMRITLDRILSEKSLLLKSKLCKNGKVVDQSGGAWHLATRDAFNLDATTLGSSYIQYAAQSMRMQASPPLQKLHGGGGKPAATATVPAATAAAAVRPSPPPPRPAAPAAPSAAGPGFCAGFILTSCFPRVQSISTMACTRGTLCKFKHNLPAFRGQTAQQKGNFKAFLDKKLASFPSILAEVESQHALTGFE